MASLSPRGPEQRPGSSSSRVAWEEKYDHNPETARSVPGILEDNAPSAMEAEIFDKDGTVRVNQRQGKEKKKGAFEKGMLSVWQTKQIVDTKYDRELYVRTTLRELIIYIIFLTLLTIVAFGMMTTTTFYFTKVISQLFLDTPDENDKTFRDITRMDDFWTYADGPLLDGLYWEKWYNDMKVNESEKMGFISFENKLIGLPRIRMLRVKNDSCQVPRNFEREIKECYDFYDSSDKVEDTASFGPQNGTAWIYTSDKDVAGGSYWGILSSYGTGGYVQLLSTRKEESRVMIASLKNHGWITRGTRVIMMDFSVYNANVNLFCIIKLVLEFSPTGGVLPSWSFRTLKLIRYTSTMDYIVLACEGIFVAFIIYYIIEEAIELMRWKWSYFKSVWNVFDILVISIALVCVTFSVYRQLTVGKKLDELLNQPDKYADFGYISYAQVQFNNMIAILVFVAWVKVFKYISFNKTMNQLNSTLSRCSKDVGGFGVMFCIFFFAYAQMGYLLFGTQVKDFSSFYDSVFSLFRTILGDFDFHEIETAQRVLGPIFFMSYIFFVFFVLLNMFLAIINDTYAEVKAELATQKNEFELTDYFRRGYYNMLRKMNIRKDKLIDIQGVLEADTDKNKQIDFDEWKEHLKDRGYGDDEIETMFAKYDLDGDRVLDEQEQTIMQLDLDGQKFDLEDSLQSSNVPPTARSRFDDLDGGDVSTARGGGGKPGISNEDFNVLNRRVDRMEVSISSVVPKIETAIDKLEVVEREKLKHRERLTMAMIDIGKSGMSDHDKQRKIQQVVQEELARYTKEGA